MSSVPCRRSICLSMEVVSPRPPRNIQHALLGCQGEACGNANVGANQTLRPSGSTPLRRNDSNTPCLSASTFLHKLLPKRAIQRERISDMSEENLQPGGDRFPPTRRSVIEAVRSIDAEERERALEALCTAYWKPIYKYVRWRWNRPANDAQDLTQGFFSELLERELLDKFDSNKSRLRTYLRVCVDSFVINEDKAGRRQKRGGSIPHAALDFAAAEEELGATVIDPAKIASPESLEEFFEKEWVRSLFALAVEDLRKLCEQRERTRTFHLFEAYDLEGNEKSSYEQLSKDYGISVTDVTNALAWARREFRKIALGRLRELGGSEEDVSRDARSAFGWDSR